MRRGSPPQQSFPATFQCRGPEVPLWDVGSSIRSLPPIGGGWRGIRKEPTWSGHRIGELEPPGLDSNPSGGLILRNLLIPQKSKTERNHENAEVRYTAGTRPDSEFAYMDGCGHCGDGHNFNPLLYL